LVDIGFVVHIVDIVVVDIVVVDIVVVDIVVVDILVVNILVVNILVVDILEVDILVVDILVVGHMDIDPAILQIKKNLKKKSITHLRKCKSLLEEQHGNH
jgi:hypothetical protein